MGSGRSKRGSPASAHSTPVSNEMGNMYLAAIMVREINFLTIIAFFQKNLWTLCLSRLRIAMPMVGGFAEMSASMAVKLADLNHMSNFCRIKGCI